MTECSVVFPPDTYEERDAFCAWLYFDQLDKPTPAGALARALKKNFLAFDRLRDRMTIGWRRCAAKWDGVDADLLLKTFVKWRADR